MLKRRDGGPPTPHPLRELQSLQVGRRAYAVLTEIVDPDGEACRTRYLVGFTQAEGAEGLLAWHLV